MSHKQCQSLKQLQTLVARFECSFLIVDCEEGNSMKFEMNRRANRTFLDRMGKQSGNYTSTLNFR